MTTADILAFCRAEVSGGSAQDAPAEEVAETPAGEETAAEETVAETAEAPASEDKPAAPKKKPTSTKDILAAARASASGGGGKAEKPAAAETKAKPKPAAAGGAKPTSTKDILAAARAAAAGGGAAKADKASPAAPAKKKAAPAAAAGGEKPSVKEMLAAFRNEKRAVESEPAATAPDGKKLPPKMPVPPRKAKVKPAPAPVNEERRSFLSSLLVIPSAFAAAWIMLAGASTAWALALVRFGLPNVLVEPPSRFKIGSPSDYDFGTVSTKWKAERGIWVVHTDRYKGKNVIVALSTVCTHLGCTPNWLEGEQKFKCPCHGSGFYIDGINFEGPAPRPLERHGITVAADGMLEVDKSLKFQEEMGQWEDPKSYVEA